MLLVELEPVIDPLINERAILLADRIRSRRARGTLRDVAPGYATLGVHFDPLQTDLAALERTIEDEFAQLQSLETVADRAPIEIPVRYDGPDLDAVAAVCRLLRGRSDRAAQPMHVSRLYAGLRRAVPLDMGRVDRSIAAPRHRVPRQRVPAGSVGIAGLQTGVYPVDSPGGWQLIGRTETVMFDADRDRPSLLSAGDLVRFVPTR